MFVYFYVPTQNKAASAEKDSSSAGGQEGAPTEKQDGEEEEESLDDVASQREKEERKKKAKALANERRAKIMAQMASMQRAFIAGWCLGHFELWQRTSVLATN